MRKPLLIAGSVLLLLILPILAQAARIWAGETVHWSAARWDSAGIAPDPAATPEAVVQVYAARTWGWRGTFGVHSWIVLKRRGESSYARYEVTGWGVTGGRAAVRRNGRGSPDGYWAGNAPALLADLRGAAAEPVVARLEQAILDYPHAAEYTLWPGPNSNTFVAHLARQAPELRLDLPPTAIGKDYLPAGAVFARAPSGTGAQVSLFGLLGLMVAVEEGIELNLFGLVLGIDLKDPALKLPGLGRVGFGAF